ncbi:MAG: RsmB/NOP family class I SAM-dependent RNA methyltransferase [Magnetococcales bacterium]|nr:RsmB/NOP family class I SAM-dependent RNA methyltransferase [Magnetococcales bacterium]
MSPDITLSLTATLLEEIFDHAAPADGAMRRLFQKRGSGPAERNRIGDLLFTVLRHRRRLERALDPHLPTANRLTALVTLAAEEQTRSDDSPSPPEPSDLSPQERCSLPEWLWEAFVAQRGATEALAQGLALNRPAPTDLRVNRSQGTREALRIRLAALGVITEPLPRTPDGLRLTGHPPVTTLDPFHQGLFEIQDEGSQWIAPLLCPRPGETVVDLCAGGGGKTLHLASLMGRKGEIIATDTDPGRLHQLSQRLRRLKNTPRVRVMPLRHEGDPALRPLTGKIDAVLVDAPCSGTGTLRRRPDLKWQLTPEQVAVLHQRQCALLDAAARLLRPGGRLVYATCSLLQQENQAVVMSFLNENPTFRQIPAMPTLAAQGFQGVYSEDTFLTLSPHLTGCDGFFAALFQRNR